MRIPLQATFLRASITKRLWMGTGAIAIFIGTLMFVQSFIPADANDAIGYGLHLKCDFIAFYTGGAFVRQGKSADLYDITKVHAFQTDLATRNGISVGSAIGPWWNPPFYAWVFVPIAGFNYPRALQIWVLLNILCAAVATVFLCRIIIAAGASKARHAVSPTAKNKTADWKIEQLPSPAPGAFSPQSAKMWLLVPALLVLSTPFLQALCHGQNTCTSLLLVTLVVVFWRKQMPILAGAFTGLMFYKPQLGVVLTAVLVLSLGWRSLIGLGITGVFLLAATLALPGSLHEFLFQMPKNLHFVQCDVAYLWDRHVTFKAFWRLLLQGMGAGEPKLLVTLLSGFCSAAIGAALLWAAVRVTKSPASSGEQLPAGHVDAGTRRDRLIAATIAATPLLMPFYFDYDQVLLAIPAVLFAADMIRRDRSLPIARADVWLMRVWPAQYAWLMLNPDIASVTHFNLGVPLLAAVVGLIIARAGRNSEAPAASGKELTAFEQRLAAA